MGSLGVPQQLFSSISDNFQTVTTEIGTMISDVWKLGLIYLSLTSTVEGLRRKHLIVDTDFFSDVE
jgi:hypothetical protein